jgi:hypothetical protein
MVLVKVPIFMQSNEHWLLYNNIICLKKYI